MMEKVLSVMESGQVVGNGPEFPSKAPSKKSNTGQDRKLFVRLNND
jgi:hypothetical protein